MANLNEIAKKFPTAAKDLDLSKPEQAATFMSRLSPEFRWDSVGLNANLRWSMAHPPIPLPLGRVPSRIAERIEELLDRGDLQPEAKVKDEKPPEPPKDEEPPAPDEEPEVEEEDSEEGESPEENDLEEEQEDEPEE